ncbi:MULTISPECIES: hypothetical protein [unclassified Microbacterium]|uniref:hypothetical protein n=1 Tax=unclassified Microbacterium TaxID=2609290 RepID=UPI0038692FE3
MARARIRPEPPRTDEPDLPPSLDPVALTRSGEVLGGRIEVGTGASDGAYARIGESVITAASAGTLDLTGAVLSDVLVDQPALAEWRAGQGTWRTVVVRGGRIGTLDASRGRWDGVILDGVRIDYLSWAAADVHDAQITGCRIGTLDAPGGRLDRVRFTDSSVDEFDTRELQAQNLDLRGLDALAFTDVRALRGATLGAAQVAAHAASFAVALGIDARDS